MREGCADTHSQKRSIDSYKTSTLHSNSVLQHHFTFGLNYVLCNGNRNELSIITWQVLKLTTHNSINRSASLPPPQSLPDCQALSVEKTTALSCEERGTLLQSPSASSRSLVEPSACMTRCREDALEPFLASSL